MSDTKTSAKSARASRDASKSWTDEERDAMKERAKELKAAARRGKPKGEADREQELLAKLSEMPESDRLMGERIHALVKANAPELTPRTWYGMPAYAKEGKVVCFFQSAAKFKSRYATLGFSDDAALDDGTMWPTSWALTELTSADDARIVELLKKAVS